MLFKTRGFTLMELVVSMAIIATVAVSMPALYEKSKDRAKISATVFDMENISKVIYTARYNVDAPVTDITEDECISCACDEMTDLSLLSSTHPCITDWDKALKKINSVADLSIEDARDRWGNPFILRENEGVDILDPCIQDEIISAGKDTTIGTEDDITKTLNFYSPRCIGQALL